MEPDFRFKLDDVITPSLNIRRGMVNRRAAGTLQVAVRDEMIGRSVINDNSQLAHRNLARFIFGYRDETEWSKNRRPDPQEGRPTVSSRKLLKVLHSPCINVDDCGEG
jgi:hypothetical protein